MPGLGPVVLLAALCGSDPAPPSDLPPLAEFARTPAPVGYEAALLDEIASMLPKAAHWDRDAFGSLIVRLDDGPLHVSDATESGRPERLVAVGVDASCFVVSRLRDDGWLRLRYLGDAPPGDDHLLREGRPAQVWTRHGPRPGVLAVDSIHLRNPRPDAIGEAELWLDVGADDATDAAALGIELLDPVVQHEVVAYGVGDVAGPALGRRAAAHALLDVMHALPSEAFDGYAFAFVAQSVPGLGALGRGGEAVVRRLRPASVLELGAAEALPMASRRGTRAPDGAPVVTLDLRVAHLGTPVERVTDEDRAAFRAALLGELTGGPEASPAPPSAPASPAPPGGTTSGTTSGTAAGTAAAAAPVAAAHGGGR